jgi:hypothetical protein
LKDFVFVSEKYNVKIIVPTIPNVCAKLSTSPNPNSIISKRRIYQFILITSWDQIAPKNIAIQKRRDLQNLLIEVKIETGDYEKTQTNARKQYLTFLTLDMCYIIVGHLLNVIKERRYYFKEWFKLLNVMLR